MELGLFKKSHVLHQNPYQNGQQSRCIFSVIDFMSCINLVNGLTAMDGRDHPLFTELL